VLPSQTAGRAAAAIRRGDDLRRRGDSAGALGSYLDAASATEIPPAELCVRLARCHEGRGDLAQAHRWALAVVDADDNFAAWQAAAAIAGRCAAAAPSRRSARLALAGSYTTSSFAPLLGLAAARFGIALTIHEGGYGQYRQDLLAPDSPLHRFAPDFVTLAVHEGALALPEYSATPREEVEAELRRWTDLWATVRDRAGARVVQHNFAIPPDLALGHLDARLPGSRYAMAQALNARLAEAAGDGVALVDCERLAATYGKERWLDPRYWYAAKQAVSPGALPLLARHTAAVLAAELGLSRKCLVLDLDNTLWGGVIGEDGLAGIVLGGTPEGEAYVAFQDYILQLKRRGVILAVLSKNNDADAKLPFARHPEMRLRLDDIAIFVANWQPKQDQIREIARVLNIGLDAIAFADDNPVEREAIRQFLPEVDVIPLPADPGGYRRALARYPGFEAAAFTPDDARRAEQYRARAALATAASEAGSLEEFQRSLQMRALVAPFTEVDLPRIAQLIGKTNQFNLTARRHGPAQLAAFMRDPECVHLSLRLRDRFGDHGLVGVLIALRRGTTLDIDTWLMSCRVIGRTVEDAMLRHLCSRARESGCTTLQGVYVPTAKNALVADLYARLGFAPVEDATGTTLWRYNLLTSAPLDAGLIETVAESDVAVSWGGANAGA
jgi:FkbH-like protein